MGSIEKRLAVLEDRLSPPDEPSPEEQARKWWFARTSISRTDDLESRDAEDARGLVGLFHVQGSLKDMDFCELVERILSWRPLPEGGRLRSTVEREVSLAVYKGREGTEHLTCPEAWREAFEAGEELLARYEAAPDEEVAKAYTELFDGGDGEVEEWSERFWSEVVKARDLLLKSEGPGVEDVPDAERIRRLHETLAPAFYGEKHYRLHRLITDRRDV